MTTEERDAFLADVHVGVIGIDQPGRGPLAVPIWYDYDPAVGIWVITSPDSRKGRLLQAAGRYSICAQVETGLYKYVSVEGPIASTREADLEKDLRPMARRYFGQEMGDQYVAASGPDRGLVYTMQPERWLTVDYAKMTSGS
ncbi:MAG: pyridoxamine 5'-phosphate oxidase family protein [Deltaproteobacteria bacterium]|nr:pyridoxamine 5'-phosphate oxidase family protein [Deltaproteobacteria bacterium]MBW2416317.1 pyridoxamine 5'-phosphate oxidase family protein [Deltaproteobacteria bacterium]